jgi:gamma-glutamyltranspeptidase / glutathione hydrolase
VNTVQPLEPPARPLVPAPIARGGSAAVVAPHHLATTAGLGILRAGGSAVDAAIAANAVLAVVAGYACGLGGDAFWLAWDEVSRRQVGLNGSGRAGARADAATLRAAGLAELPARGPLTITVPGAVRSWADAHAQFGRLDPAAVLGPAIELAGGGFPADDAWCAAVERAAGGFDTLGAAAAGWHAVYRPAGRPWRPGERVRLPALAATLQRLASAGWDDFYGGEIGCRQASALDAAGALVTAGDLVGHTSTWTEPIAFDYRATRVTTHAPNSSGLVALQILAILARFEPPAAGEFRPGDGGATAGPGPDWVHAGIEATKLALADRDRYLADPERVPVPVDRLLDPGYVTDLAGRIDRRRAAAPAPAGLPPGGGTIWLGAVDRDGNAVSLVQSNFAGFGSGIVDPATGIGYQNRGTYFRLEPGHPNGLAPGKRTLHTLMPGMLFRDGRPWVILGSMGGDAQPAIHAQVVSGLVDGRLDVASAVAAPRWFPEPATPYAPPDIVRIEPRFRAGLLPELAARGHRLAVVGPYDSGLGHCHAIELVDGGPASGGTLAAATDPRSAGLPATW